MEASRMAIVIGYFGALAAFLAADMVWLGAMASRVYRPVLGDMAAPTVNLPAAAVFYLLFPVGIAIFAVAPALAGRVARLGRDQWRPFLLFHLRHLRLDQSGDAAQLDDAADADRRCIGRNMGALAASAGFLAASRFATAG